MSAVTRYWMYVVAAFVVLIVFRNPVFLLLYLIIGVSYLASRRAMVRGAIRQKYSISGDFGDDCFFHCCCSSCSVCQEARELKLMNVKPLDFCSGEDLLTSSLLHNQIIETSTDGGSFYQHIQAISRTSRIILMLCGFVASLSFFIQLVTGRYDTLVISILVFVQPIFILYIVFWRSRRKYASMDYVIKLFACGFWITTFQSAILELVLQLILTVLLSPFLSGINYSSIQNDDSPSNSQQAQSLGMSMQSYFNQQLVRRRVFTSTARELVQYMISSFVSDKSYHDVHPAYLSTSLIGSQPFTHFDMLNTSMYNTSSFSNSTSFDIEQRRELMKNHIVVLVVALFLMAFVVAAGVEETMKHFAVRCCQFPVALQDPHSVLVYLMAGALGFATAENIE